MRLSLAVMVTGFGLSLIFTAYILLLRVQPQRYLELPALLSLPDACEAPCFMGIQPGISTAAQAADLLAAHKWVTTVTDNTSYTALNEPASSGLNGEITWRWSGSQPDWIDADTHGWLWVSRNQVQSLNIGTHLTLGESRLLFGLPDLEVVVFTAGSTTPEAVRVNYRAGYVHSDLIFSTLRDCPASNFWHSPVLLRVVHGLTAAERFNAPAIIYREC